MNLDPNGYYARLGVAPEARDGEIVAAFRRRARVVHPDIPGTGDASAFVALKTAYDVLADPVRRAAYDRGARQHATMMSKPRAAAEPVRRPRFSDLPPVVWLAFLGVAAVAATAAVLQLRDIGQAPAHSSPPPVTMARRVPQAAAVTSPSVPDGVATHYVTAGPEPAALWLRAASGDGFVPAGQLAPYTGVHAIALLPEHGLVEISLRGGHAGFVDAARLAPGGTEAAHQAYCADQAGAPPGEAALLARRGSGGSARLVIRNHGEEPSVVKLRDLGGRTEASLFIAPHMNVTVMGLPAGPWRADVAVGELWSRACRTFAIGMRAERLPGLIEPGGELLIPPDLPAAAPPVDIPNDAFIRD
ncbi:MAG: J domain-containing protein [Acetobacteraceae bacterium]